MKANVREMRLPTFAGDLQRLNAQRMSLRLAMQTEFKRASDYRKRWASLMQRAEKTSPKRREGIVKAAEQALAGADAWDAQYRRHAEEMNSVLARIAALGGAR